MSDDLTDYEYLRDNPSEFVESIIDEDEFDKAYRNTKCLRVLYHDYSMSQREIADLFDVNQVTIHNWMDKNNIDSRGPAGVVSPPISEEKLRFLYKDRGYGTRTIADTIDASRNTIRRWLDILDIEKHPSGEKVYNEDVLNTVVKLYNDGYTQKEISEKVSVNQTTVSRWLRMEDVCIRNKAGFGSRQTTDRGEIVKSTYERKVANCLYENELNYTYEPDLDKTDYIPDFEVNNKILEVWGIKNDDRYDERRENKLNVYAQLGYEVFSVFPKTIESDLSDVIKNV